MLRFLGPEWLAALGDAAAGSEALRRVAEAGVLVIEQVVGGVPGDGGEPAGEVRYHLVLDPGPPPAARVVPGPAPAPDLVLHSDHATALALARGTANAQDAIAAGCCRLRGRIGLLAARQGVIAALGDVFAAVRVVTDLGPPQT